MGKLNVNDFNALVNGGIFMSKHNAKRRKAVKMALRAKDTNGKRGWPAMAEKRYGCVTPVVPARVSVNIQAYATEHNSALDAVSSQIREFKKLTPKQRVLSKYPNARLMADNEEGGYRVVKGEGLAVMLGAGPTANAAWAAAAKAV